MGYSAEECFKLRQMLREDASFNEPEAKDSVASYGDFQLVGHGVQTNVYCGQFFKLRGCLREDLHRLVTLDGVNYAGKVFRRIVLHYCHNPRCPVCYRSGWAVREAERIEARLKEASKRFGLVEHIVVSVPLPDYDLPYESLRKKVDGVLSECGVVGGVKIFHGFRFNELTWSWYWNPHFHVLGFILGGYGRCRRCLSGGKFVNCYACNGFQGRVYRLYRKNGYIVKCLDERITVFGTAWYQLNHSTVDVTEKRFHVATWFGVCSYRKLRITVEKRKQLCPICQSELGDVRYCGVHSLVVDRDSPDFKRDSVEDFLEDGFPAWCECEPKEGW